LHAEVGKFACKPHAVKTRACWRQVRDRFEIKAGHIGGDSSRLSSCSLPVLEGK